ELLRFGTLGLFARVHIHLPVGHRGETGDSVTVGVQPTTVRNDVKVPPPLLVTLIPIFFPNHPPFRSASSVFHDDGDNTKEDLRMAGGVVWKGVVGPGWLMEGMPYPTPGIDTRDNETEDYHYDILIDADFIRRTYGSPPIQPLTNAIIPG